MLWQTCRNLFILGESQDMKIETYGAAIIQSVG